MNKDEIIINSFSTKYDKAPFNDYKLTLLYLDINFDYKSIYDANIRISTNELLNFDEIKDKIIEVITL